MSVIICTQNMLLKMCVFICSANTVNGNSSSVQMHWQSIPRRCTRSDTLNVRLPRTVKCLRLPKTHQPLSKVSK